MIFEEDVDSFLLRYLLNELDPKDREKVEEWIVANEENRRYYQAYQKLIWSYAGWRDRKRSKGTLFNLIGYVGNNIFGEFFTGVSLVLLSCCPWEVLSGTGMKNRKCDLFRSVYNRGSRRLYFIWHPDRLLTWIRMPKN